MPKGLPSPGSEWFLKASGKLIFLPEGLWWLLLLNPLRAYPIGLKSAPLTPSSPDANLYFYFLSFRLGRSWSIVF